MRRHILIAQVILLSMLMTGCTGDTKETLTNAVSRIQDAGERIAEAVVTAARSALPEGLEGIFSGTPTIRILNPTEELSEFDPAGILRWSAVSGADAYEVWVYRDSSTTLVQEASAALTSRQYQFTKLLAGQTYYIKIYYRVNGSWQESPLITLSTVIQVVKARLSNPQDELDAFGQGGVLRWSAVAGADIYEVWFYRDAALTAFAETSGPVRITQYQPATLKTGTTYYVQVYARVNGVFKVGGPLTLTMGAQINKARIVNPQEELDAFAVDGLLRWSPVTGATSYELWIFTNPNSSETQEGSGPLTSRLYSPRTLQPGRVYYAQAYSKVNGVWQVGAPVRITTTAQPSRSRLTNPQEEIENFRNGDALRWSAIPGATAYEVWIYGNAGLGTIIESGSAGSRSFTPTKLCVGGTYHVQVYALVAGQWTTGWATRLDVTQGSSGTNCSPPVPKITLTAGADEVYRGESVTLSWATQFADSCTASNGWSGTKATSGSETIGPLNAATLFTLTCSGKGGSYKAETLVTTTTTLNRAISVSPASIDYGSVAVGSESPSRTIVVRNTGNAATTVSSVGLTGTHSNQFTGTQTCNQVLAGNTCEISLKFKPTSTGAKTAAVSIAHNGTGTPATVQLSGTGTSVTYSLTMTVTAEAPSPGQTLPFTNPNVGGNIVDFKNPRLVPIARTYIQLTNSAGTLVANGFTDANGRMTFTGLDSSVAYRVSVGSAAYTPDGLNVWVMNNRSVASTTAQKFRDRYFIHWVSVDIPIGLGIPNPAVERTLTIGSGYDATGRQLLDDRRSSGPFLILSYIVKNQAFLTAAGAPATSWPELTVLWSPTNRGAGDNDTYRYDEGIAGNSGAFYNPRSTGFINASGVDTQAAPSTDQKFIYLSGAQAFALMELSSTVPIHELTHYVQDSSMRQTTPGGPHTTSGEWQDFTLAQHEGFATAMALLADGSPVEALVYRLGSGDPKRDQYDAGYISGGTDYRKLANGADAGWFQESSFTSFIWRLHDPLGAIRLTPGKILAPFYSQTWSQAAWTPSPWAYGAVLKAQNPEISGAIDSLAEGLKITLAGNDHWGTTEKFLGNRAASQTFPVHTRVPETGTVQVCSVGSKAEYNKLGNRRYLRFEGSGASRLAQVTGPAGTVPYVFINGIGIALQKGSNALSGRLTIPASGAWGYIGECSVVYSPSATAVDGACANQPYTPPAEVCWTITTSN
jgi:hypothetical protein